MNINSKVSQSERDDAFLERDAKMTNSSYAGMQDSGNEDDMFDDFDFGNMGGESSGNSSSGSSDSNDILGGLLGGGNSDNPWGVTNSWGTTPGMGLGMTGNQQETPPKSKASEIADEVTKIAYDKTKEFTKAAIDSSKRFNNNSMYAMGWTISKLSVALIFISVIFILMGYTVGLYVLDASLLCMSIGIPLYMMGYERHQYDPPQEESSGLGEIDMFSDSGSDDTFDDDYGLDDDDDYGFGSDEDYGGIEAMDDYDDGSSDIDSMLFSDDNVVEEKEIDVESELASMNTNGGMMTRAYIYERLRRLLPNATPNFSEKRPISESSDDFRSWNAIVVQSAKMLTTNEQYLQDLPYVVSAKEHLFYVDLEVKRVKWIKNPATLLTEIVNICSFDSDTHKRVEGIYGKIDTVGDKYFIQIMKGETAKVSLNDLYNNKKVEDFILDSKNMMPVVWGVGAQGEAIYSDIQEMYSLLIVGQPRTGKSWVLQFILLQMMAYLPPSKLNFYCIDAKGKSSDFTNLMTPHVKKLVSEDKDIIDLLRNIIQIEGKRRSNLIGDAGCKKIEDFWDKCPDVELPYIYICIDEVVTLAERMEKETKDEFQSLLLEIITRMPSYGIRLIMVPHVVKNDILKKTMTDNIPCRISVMGDAPAIESACGVKNFDYRLSTKGDMCAKFQGKDAMYIHSGIITNSDEDNKKLFSFIGGFWAKAEPYTVADSIMGVDKTKENIYKEVSKKGYIDSASDEMELW